MLGKLLQKKCTLQILHNDLVFEPAIEEGITWETERVGAPGKLTFTVIKTPDIWFNEGDQVKFTYDGINVFHGFVFTKTRNKDHYIQVTAYDQMRYLKNKTTYIMSNVRADQVLKRIADDFLLRCGELPNTGFVIPRFEQSNVSLFDIILDALDYTVMNTGNLYYLYDDFGKLMLKNIKDSALDVIIHEETAEDFDYSTSIDSNTYNRIIITDSENQSEENIVKEHDQDNIKKWGVLQLVETAQNGENSQAKAAALLKMHNRISRSLQIKGQFGDVRCRAGAGIYLSLNLGDMVANQRMLIEKATHTFNENDYVMDLTLMGCDEFYD